MPSSLSQISHLADALLTAGEGLTQAAQEKFKRAPVPRGATLRPGMGTPLWLGLTGLVRPLLRAYGAKALLARELGVHRSRITAYFITRSAMPDAERTLRLLEWLGKACSREPLRRGRSGVQPQQKGRWLCTICSYWEQVPATGATLTVKL
jgi:hypothetical protein